ncbi:MAG: O-antigen ligase family protein [Scytolyngbya sp. HA4215-MV1]|nr:O-antigen ligase family protein [Scytolyngbya sp. HA4215-MV1]
MVWAQHWHRLIRQPLLQGFGVLSLCLLLSASLAYKPGEAFLGLVHFLPFFGIFAALSLLIQTSAQLRRLAWVLVLGSVPVTLVGLGQMFWGWAGPVQVLWIVVNWILPPTGNPPGRMDSVFEYANVLASYLVMVFVVTLGLWIHRNPWRPENVQDQNEETVASSKTLPLIDAEDPRRVVYRSQATPSLRVWLFLTACLGADAIALILTNSRNAWAIVVLVCLAYAVYLGWHWLLVLVGGVTGTVLLSAFGPEPLRQKLRQLVPAFFWARLTDEMFPDRPLPTLRTMQWRFAVTMAQQRPWTGWGLRNFSPLYQEKMHFWLGHPHNLPLMLAAETGIPATILFLGLVGWVFGRGWWKLSQGFGTLASPSFEDRLMFFTYLLAFSACTLFSLSDITLFDARINLLGWLLLAAIRGYGTKAALRCENNLA